MPDKLSRREFFGSFMPSKKKPKEKQEEQKPQQEEPSKITQQQDRLHLQETQEKFLMSRREVLSMIVGTGLGIAGAAILQPAKEKEEKPFDQMSKKEFKEWEEKMDKLNKQREQQRKLQKSDDYESQLKLMKQALDANIEKDPDYVRTLLETSLLSI